MKEESRDDFKLKRGKPAEKEYGLSMVDGESDWGGRGRGEVGPKDEPKDGVVEGGRKSSGGDELTDGDDCRVREEEREKEGKTQDGE